MTAIRIKGNQMKRLIIVMFFAHTAFAQPPQTTTLASPPPPPPQAQAFVTGNPGSAAYNYWVIANYPGGSAVGQPANVTFAPNTLSGGNFVTVSWAVQPGASTFDVIRLTPPAMFTGVCTSCAVATALGSTVHSLNDTGASLVSYTQAAPVTNGQSILYLNTRDYTPPQIRQVTNGVDSALGTAGPAGPTSLLVGALGSIPATCTPGVALYQATDQPVGLQVYVCTSTNTWTREAYTQGASNPGTCTVGQIFYNTAQTAGFNLQLCTSTNTFTPVVSTISRFVVAGANGNDTGNDTPALAAAVAAACNGSTPGTVLLGPVTGTGPIYRQTTKLNLVANCTFVMGTSTLHMVTANLNSMEINGNSNITINGGTLDGGEIASAGGAASNITIQGMTIKNTGSNSGVFRFALYSASPCTNCVFQNNTVINVGGVMDVATAHSFKVLNNNVTTCNSATCFNFHDGGASDTDPLSSYNIEISSNSVTDAYQFGIQIQSWMAYQSKVIIVGNSLKGWNASTVAAGGNGISCDPASAGGGCLISGNYVQGLGAIDTRTYIGIENTATGTVSSHNTSIGWQEGIFNDGGAVNIGSYNSVVDNYIYNCNHGISVQGGANVDIQIARNYIFEYVAWGVLFDVNTGSGANVIENHFFRTPHNTDTGGPTAIGTQAIGTSGKVPQTFRDNTNQWLAGTFATGIPYQMFFVAANTSGSIFSGNKDENLNASFATLFGFNCNSGTVLDANSITNSSWVNVNPTNCTSPSSTVAYNGNSSRGTSAINNFLTTGNSTNCLRVDGSNGACGSGGSPISGATTNACVSAASATTIQTPSANCLIDPATGNLSAPVVTSGTPSAGTIAALPTGSHGFSCDESTTAGVPAAGTAYIRCDSTSNTILQSVNGSAEMIVGSTTKNAATFTPGTGVTSATCITALCTSARGTLTIVGGTGTTGTITGVAWSATPTIQVCTATMNGGTGFLGIGNSVATTTGFNITAAVTVIGVTLTVNYSCQP